MSIHIYAEPIPVRFTNTLDKSTRFNVQRPYKTALTRSEVPQLAKHNCGCYGNGKYISLEWVNQ